MRTKRGIISRIAVFSICFYLAAAAVSLFMYPDGWMPAGLLPGVGILAGVWLISGKIKSDRAAVLFLLLFGLAVTEIWNILIRPVPVSDYEVLWQGAHQILDGTFAARAADPADYFSFYNFQIPYAAYLAGLLKLFGSLEGVTAFRAIVPVMTGAVLYRTVRLYSGIREALFAALLYLANPFIFFGSGILNNQHECMLLEAMAVYTFLRIGRTDRQALYWAPGLLLGIANLFRPTASVICAALGIVLLGRVLREKKLRLLAAPALLAGAMLAVRFAGDGLFRAAGIAPGGVSVGNPWFKLSLGLTGSGITGTPTTDAEHTNLYYDLQRYGFDYAAYNEAAFRYIRELIRQPFTVIGYVLGKIIYYAGGADAQYTFTNPAFVGSHRALAQIVNGAGMAIYAASLIGTLAALKGEETEGRKKIMPAGILIFLGYFAAYILLEAQTRYRYEQYYALFLMGIPGIPAMAERGIRRMKKRGSSFSRGL